MSRSDLDRPAKEALASAVRADDAAQVASVLERYPVLRSLLDDALVPDFHFGATPLLGAVHHGNRQMIDVLLQAGANINARSHWWAGSFGVLDSADADLAAFLLERGAALDIHAAARLGVLDRVRELVAADPELVRARGGDGQTPLHFASSIEIAEYLLEHGADIDARDVDHESTPAQYMVRDRQAIAAYLVGRGCTTDILMAAALGSLDEVRRHLALDPTSIRTMVSEKYFPKHNPKSGGSIYNWTLGTDKTAHVIAREFEHDDVYQLLMEHSPDSLRLSVLSELGDVEAVRTLLAKTPEIELGDEDRRRIAHAARNNHTKAVELMLVAGWPVDARGQHGGTPLHWSAWHGNREMAEALIRHGAPLEVIDDDYRVTPLQWAVYGSVHGWNCKNGDYAGTVEALLRAGASLATVEEATEASDAVREVLREYAG